jgi:hypothetical protein
MARPASRCGRKSMSDIKVARGGPCANGGASAARSKAGRSFPRPAHGSRYRYSPRPAGFDRRLSAAAFSTRETKSAAVSSCRLRLASRATDSTSESRPSLAQ